MSITLLCGDNLDVLKDVPDGSFDLTFCSPPYVDCRTYGIDFKLTGQEWVDWAVDRFEEHLRVTKGLVAWVIEGKTKKFRWDATPALLMADLHRRGVKLRKPPAFHRVGIPGSGGPDWLRNDYEFIVCATHGKLPWSENTVMGHPPKWAPGGEMSNRLSSGARVNQWETHIDQEGRVSKGGQDGATGKRAGRVPLRPSHREVKMISASNGDGTRDNEKGESYTAPVLANPGNVIKCKVGGGLMGHELSHENEAPFPLTLAEFFVRSFCPPGGIVLDPFCGSGTTGHAAILHGRNFTGIDIRQSQIELTQRRLDTVEPLLIPNAAP